MEPVWGQAFIPPGTPWNNGVVELFHRRRRYECLVRNDFGSLLELPCVHR
ncbi:integrase core domain-containing protein [Corynebacterium choanae]